MPKAAKKQGKQEARVRRVYLEVLRDQLGHPDLNTARFYEILNAFHQHCPAVGLAPDPGYNLANPGSSWAMYEDTNKLLVFLDYVSRMPWVNGIPSGTLILKTTYLESGSWADISFTKA